MIDPYFIYFHKKQSTMNPILKNVLAVIAGVVIGSVVNMGLIIIGPSIIPIPEGIDPMDPESLKAGMSLFKPIHFIFPFLAHALGTLVGALVAAKIAATHKLKFALGIGIIFLAGGIWNAMELGGPMWFNILDLFGAYIPMAMIGGKLGIGKN